MQYPWKLEGKSWIHTKIMLNIWFYHEIIGRFKISWFVGCRIFGSVETFRRNLSIGAKTRKSQNISAKSYMKKVIIYITAPKVSLLGGFWNWCFPILLVKILLKTLKVSATSEVGFFLILLAYALTGLTYNFKEMDRFMLSIWITYFLYSFRSDLKMKVLESPLWHYRDSDSLVCP